MAAAVRLRCSLRQQLSVIVKRAERHAFEQQQSRGLFGHVSSNSGSSSSSRDGEEAAPPGVRHFRFVAASTAATLSFAAASMVTQSMCKERPPADRVPKEVVLYQYEACPFCNKVKAYLDYYDIPYRVVEVNPWGKKEISWSQYKKVPILMVDGEQLNDSSEIISTLDRKVNPRTASSLTAAAAEEEEKWRKWVDNHLVHLLSPNIYRSTKEALQAFDYITTQGNFSAMERATAKYAGATAMYFISKRLKKKHNITDERAALYAAADEWVKALDNRSFMGGSKPNLADLAVFGVLRPIKDLEAGKDMLANSSIGPWYARMEQAVGDSARIKKAQEEGLKASAQAVEMPT